MTKVAYPPHLQTASANHRVIVLDALRVFLALWVLLYHSMIHLQCDYGFLNTIIKHQTIPMTLFFMLSGYSLQMVYGRKMVAEGVSLKVFYTKRLIAIWPLYMVCTILIIIMNVVAGYQTIGDNLVLMPVEVLGLQAVFPGSLFEYASNSGTWFISCLFVCYLLFPLLSKMIHCKDGRNTWLFVALFVLWCYLTVVGRRFEVQFMYTNPLMRVLEFMVGMALAMNLNMRSTPISTLLKPLVYISNLSLALFLGQGFVILPLKYCLKYNVLPFEFSNIGLIAVVIIVAYTVSVLLHELVENPFKRLLHNKLVIVRQ